jgi:hypothetical protein
LRILDTSGRRAPLVAAVLLSGCLIAACGSSSSSTTSSSSTRAAAASPSGTSSNARRASLRTCLKAHGVTLPSRPAGAGGPPPGGGGPGFFGGGGGGGGGLANNPKFRAAVQACGGGNFRGGARRPQLSHAAVTAYVSCVRQHGYNMPSPNFSGKGGVFPTSIRTDPKFQAASKPCQNLLFPRRGGGTGTTATGPKS